MHTKTTATVGAALGFTGFLFVGLLPSIIYGGYAGLLLAAGIFGTPVPAHLAARGLVVLGMVMATIGVASLFTVIGAVVGALTGHLFTPTEVPAHAERRLFLAMRSLCSYF